MKELTFDKLIGTGVVLIVVANALAFWFHIGILVNIAWILYGALCLLHPVCPVRWKDSEREKTAVVGVRIAGAICVAIGLLTRFVV